MICKFLMYFFSAILVGMIICFSVCGKLDFECLKERGRSIGVFYESNPLVNLNESIYRKSERKPNIQVVWQAKQYLKNTTINPQTLQYRNIKSFFGKDGNSYACGEFNIKNKHNKYVGFRKFIFNGHTMLIEGETKISFDSLIKDFCILNKLPKP